MNIISVNAVLAIVCIMANMRRTDRLALILAAFLVQIFHAVAFDSHSSPFAYYGGAATCDAVIIACASFVRPSQFSHDIQWINFAAIVLDLFGFIGYWFYVSPSIYMDLARLILAIQTIRMLVNDEVENEHQPNARTDKRGDVVHRSAIYNRAPPDKAEK